MTSAQANRRMILCSGLQSGGTTLVSWCFLQRADTDGVLDMKNDLIYTEFDRVRAPTLWVKMTIGAFRWLDVYDVYRDLGWTPAPLLIVRDTRTALASLLAKPWGVNGTVAEEPPLRMRLRRFLQDWKLFQTEGWPTLRFEDLLELGQPSLSQACDQLSLPWDNAMVSWRKTLKDIAYVGTPNSTFAKSIEQGCLSAALLQNRAALCIEGIPPCDLDWLEETFAEYNTVHGYPLKAERRPDGSLPHCLPPPALLGTKRQKIQTAIEHLQWIPQILRP